MKRKHSVGYFSAYYRGLECLLKMWPAIRKEVPDATLDIYYGWQSWDAMEGEQGKPFKQRVLALLDELKDQGVTEHGRVSHEQLAEAMNEIQVWAYPTEFAEIFAITMTKVLAAGCYPVTTGVAALAETQGGFGTTIKTANIYSNDYAQQKFIKAVVTALQDESYDPEPARKWAADNFDWTVISGLWENVFSEEDTPEQAEVRNS